MMGEKVWLVAANNMMPEVNGTHYAGIASLMTVRICVFLTMFNGLEIGASDISNAYLEALTRENHCITRIW